MTAGRRVRIGIDVGGTFTHAVALDADTLAVVGKVKVPTTHTAAEGVARGVVDSLRRLLDTAGLAASEVLLIAHSTTQATNALLEGDVARVGILGMGGGASAWLAARQTAIPPVPLGGGGQLATRHCFLRSERVDEAGIAAALDRLVQAGAEVIVAAEAFSVDDPRHERLVCEVAAARGLLATATHHVSRLHGLGVRTRTAVINASMLPRMLNTANMTEQAVRQAGIAAPVMIMRSDGGLMDIAEMRRRPILTMLSGPAAGVAAALLYARVSDGIFLEVGGTSTDISAIKNGRCQVRTAEVGGQRLHVRTLDVRTTGVAGGSLVERRGPHGAGRVGPRSAHIAGLPYLSFQNATTAVDQPDYAYDGRRYWALRLAGQTVALTPTCAANLLGLVPAGDPAAGNLAAVTAGFEALSGGRDPAGLARQVLERAAAQLIPLIEGLIRDYKLKRELLRLVGGGGGAAALVPFVARAMNLPCELVENADVLSAIGVALAMVRDSVERTVIDPTDEDVRRVRGEAFDSVLKMGAAAETIQVFVEVDARRNLVRATAEGTLEIRQQEVRPRTLDPDARRAVVAASMGGTCAPPACAMAAAGFEIWTAEREEALLGGWVKRRSRAIRVLDRAGTIRWASNDAEAYRARVATAEAELRAFAEPHTRYSDAGATIPRCFALVAARVLDFSGLADLAQVCTLLRLELQHQSAQDECVLLLARRLD